MIFQRTEIDLMKPFITPDIDPTGKKSFKYQCEGILYENLRSQLIGKELLAYSIFENQSLQATWDLSFIFDSDLVVKFSSACTQAIDWQEVGSLNMLFSNRIENEPNIENKIKIFISPIKLMTLEKLIYEDDDVVVECGLIFCGRNDQQIIVSAGISPGSVSVQAQFTDEQEFEPQFPLSICRREKL